MANQKLNATITLGAALSSTFKKTIGGAVLGLNKLEGEIGGIVKRQRELDKQRKILERQKQPVEALTAEYEQLGRELDRLRSKQRRIDGIFNATRQVGSEIRSLGATVKQQATVAAIAVGTVGAAVIGLAKSTADAGDEIGETAAKIGISTDALQELRYAAKMSGVEIEAFDSGLVSMTKNIGMAARGQGKAKKGFAALGIDVKKLIKLKPDQQLEAIMEALSKVPNQTDRAALAMQVLGDAGKDMVLMAANGADGIQAYRDEAKRLGLVLSEDAIKNAGGFNDALDRSKFALQGVRNTIGAALLPSVTTLLEKFSEFVTVHRPQIEDAAKSIGKFFEENADDIGRFAWGIGKMIWAVGKGIGAVLTWAHDVTGSWTMVGAAVAAAFMVPTLFAIARTVWAIGGLIRTIGGIGGAWQKAAAQSTAAAATMEANAAKAGGKNLFGRTLGKGLLGLGLAAWLAPKVDDAMADIPSDPVEREKHFQKKRAETEDTIRNYVPGMSWLMDKQQAMSDWYNAPDPWDTSEAGAVARATAHPNPNARSGRGTGAVAVREAKAAAVTNTVNVGGIVVNAPPGMTPAEIGAMVAQKIRDAFRNASAGALHDGPQ